MHQHPPTLRRPSHDFATDAGAPRFDEAKCLLGDMEGTEAVYEVRRLAAANRRRWFKERGLQPLVTRARKPRGPR